MHWKCFGDVAKYSGMSSVFFPVYLFGVSQLAKGYFNVGKF